MNWGTEMFDIHSEVIHTHARIHPYIRQTPLDFSVQLSNVLTSNIYLKCENLQYTGAFKVRGAFSKLLSLTKAERQQGIVTASSGNHGTAVAFGLSKLTIPGIVFLPENTSSIKVNNIRNYNIPIEFYGTDCVQTEIYARQYAKKHNMIYVSPYNDLQVIAGQGTVGLELMQQLDNIDVILVPVGGGGLISGIAGYVKTLSPNTMIIGCLPENSPVMAESVKANQIVEMETLPTLSDATAGGIESGSITFEMCKRWVDDFILVSEEAIKNALINMLSIQPLTLEGAAGVAIASLFKNAIQFHGKNVVVVLSGGNISLETIKKILA